MSARDRRAKKELRALEAERDRLRDLERAYALVLADVQARSGTIFSWHSMSEHRRDVIVDLAKVVVKIQEWSAERPEEARGARAVADAARLLDSLPKLEYGHDRPPPGYLPCTRPRGHDGPCAHPPAPYRCRNHAE